MVVYDLDPMAVAELTNQPSDEVRANVRSGPVKDRGAGNDGVRAVFEDSSFALELGSPVAADWIGGIRLRVGAGSAIEDILGRQVYQSGADLAAGASDDLGPKYVDLKG